MQNWVINTVRDLGPIGVGLLMLLENVFPPLPSELIMPLAGYLSAKGEMNFAAAVAVGTAGSLLGTTLWYWVGRLVDEERLEAWLGKYGIFLAMKPEDVDRVRRYFERYGGITIIVGRLIPGVRTVVSVPAGVTRMPFWRFLAYSVVGVAAWTAALAYAGRLLGKQFPQVEQYVGYVVWVLLAVAVGWYVVRIICLWNSGGRKSAKPAGQEA